MTHDHQHHGSETAIDPVCEMVVDPATARSAEVRGKMYYFCSEGCRTKFVADPDKYLNKVPFVLPVKKVVDGARPPHPPVGHLLPHGEKVARLDIAAPAL